MSLSNSKNSGEPEADNSTALTIELDGTKSTLNPSNLLDPESCFAMVAAIGKGTTAKLKLDHIIDWPQPAAETLIGALANSPKQLSFVVGGKRTPKFSRAIALLLTGCDVASACKRLIHYLVLWIALRAIDQPASAEDVKELRDAYDATDIKCPTVAKLKSTLNQVRKELIADSPPRPTSIELQLLFPDVPVVASLVIPAGYQVSADGVFSSGKCISRTPILVTGLVKGDDHTGDKWQIAIRCDGEVRRREFPASELLKSGTNPKLSDHGVDVTSETSKSVVRWLQEFRNANAGRLPRISGTPQLGHHQVCSTGGGSQSVFVLGDVVLSADDSDEAAAEVKFIPPDVGDDEWAQHWHSCGEFEAWRQTIKPILAFPVARFAVLASLAAPLLPILAADNFVFHLAGGTSTGKSTVLLAAASVWGVPLVRGGIVRTWKSTAVGIERALGMLNGLPFFIDEMVLAGNGQLDVEPIAYMVVEGQTKARGTVIGQARAMKFSTIMLTTGESSLVGPCTNEGILGRVVEFRDRPCGEDSETSRLMVEQTKADLLKNFGLLGPRFAKYLLAHSADCDCWRARFRQLIAEECSALSANAPSHANRMAQNLAVIRVTSELVQQMLGTTKFLSDPIPSLRDRIHAVAKSEDKFDITREKLISAVRQQRLRYPYRSQLVGKFEFDGVIADDGLTVFFLPQAFKKIVEADGGQPVDAVLAQFAARGWLQVEKGTDGDRPGTQRRFKVKRTLGGEKCEVIALKVPTELRFASKQQPRAAGVDEGALWQSKKSARKTPKSGKH